MRLSQRLSRLSQTPGKSRAADMRDRLSQPYVSRLGKSLSLGWETLPPLKGAGRGEKTENLLPVCQDAAKGRQMELAGTRPNKTDLVVKLPPPQKSKARDAAGKAAGANQHTKSLPVKLPEPKNSDARGDMTKKAVPQKVAEPKNSDARDAAGRAYTSLRLSTVRSIPPTRHRASSRDGDGTGVSLVGTETEKSYLAAVLYPRRFRSPPSSQI